MLKKSLVLGAIAAISMVSIAPAAFAGDQVQGNTTVTDINVGVVGNGNRTNVSNETNVNQQQSQFSSGSRRYGRHSRRCNTSNQTQGNVTDTVISTGVVGNRNRTNVRNVTNVNQGQVAGCF